MTEIDAQVEEQVVEQAVEQPVEPQAELPVVVTYAETMTLPQAYSIDPDSLQMSYTLNGKTVGFDVIKVWYDIAQIDQEWEKDPTRPHADIVAQYMATLGFEGVTWTQVERFLWVVIYEAAAIKKKCSELRPITAV